VRRAVVAEVAAFRRILLRLGALDYRLCKSPSLLIRSREGGGVSVSNSVLLSFVVAGCVRE